MKTELGPFGLSDQGGSIRRSPTLSATFLELDRIPFLACHRLNSGIVINTPDEHVFLETLKQRQAFCCLQITSNQMGIIGVMADLSLSYVFAEYKM